MLVYRALKFHEFLRELFTKFIVLVKLFGDTRPGVPLLRDLGLLLFDLSPTAKQALSRLSWGFAGRTPRLGRGLGVMP